MVRSIAFLTVVLIAAVVFAQHHPPTTDPTGRMALTRPASQPRGKDEEKSADHVVVTSHKLKLGDRTLKYTATAGTLAQKDEAGTTKSDMFFVAYELDRGESSGPTTRPVTFVFNGGPGAASVWLHLGTVGPKRINVTDEGLPIGPPYVLVDNESTWLDGSDLVFIDPVGTGYSRPA